MEFRLPIQPSTISLPSLCTGCSAPILTISPVAFLYYLIHICFRILAYMELGTKIFTWVTENNCGGSDCLLLKEKYFFEY